MRKFRVYAPALALMLYSGCFDTSGCLDVTSINHNDNQNGVPTPTATPTPIPCFPALAPCTINTDCCSVACVAGACL